MNDRSRIGRLHVITDVAVQSRFDHVQLAEMACAGGADVIQLRDKSLTRDAFDDIARRIREVCARHDVTFVVNDRVEAARAVHAGGVHVGGTDVDVSVARSILGEGAIVGASAGSPEAALAAIEEGADYLGVGHVFATGSKAKVGDPIGVQGLAAVCGVATVPVIAIGGISVERVAAVIEAGAHGIAVIGAVCAAPEPEEATRRLADALAGAGEPKR